MTIWVVMISNRHFDPEPHLYADRDAALAAARSAAGDIEAAEQEITKHMARLGWVWIAVHEEGDAVWVLPKEIVS